MICGALLFAVHSAANAQNCKVQVRSDVVFGTYDPLQSGNLDATGQLRMRCSPHATNVVVRLGTGLSGSYQPRYMQSGINRLGYNLYLDASRTVVWGDGTSGTDYLLVRRLSRWRWVSIYGRTPLGQNVAPGSYSDTLVVTIEW
jgi:spore coat protein U-like protein